MNITRIVQRRDDRLEIQQMGDVLTLNGEVFDFSDLPEGGRLAQVDLACVWLASDVVRQEGEIHLSVIDPLGPEPQTLDHFVRRR